MAEQLGQGNPASTETPSQTEGLEVALEAEYASLPADEKTALNKRFNQAADVLYKAARTTVGRGAQVEY